MTIDFLSRMIGTVIFALIGARLGVESATTIGLPADITAAIFALVGVLVGLILTPWLTIRPLRYVRPPSPRTRNGGQLVAVCPSRATMT